MKITPATPEERFRLERGIVGKDIPGFYPTPKPFAMMMARLLGPKPGDRILEPSAGLGDLADAVKLIEPDASLEVVEIDPRLYPVLEAKGHALADDHAFHFGGSGYDGIIMNPPFDAEEDIVHVMRAYERLKDGGRMVAMVSAGSAVQPVFRDWLQARTVHAVALPATAFDGPEAFRRTRVRTKVFTLLKHGG